MRGCAVTSASDADGRQLKHVITKDNTASDVWADSAYRSKKNEKWLVKNMLVHRIHRRKPANKPMPEATGRANAKKSSIRARVEHVFAHQKNRYGLFIRTIGLARAEAKIALKSKEIGYTAKPNPKSLGICGCPATRVNVRGNRTIPTKISRFMKSFPHVQPMGSSSPVFCRR
ncbi:transposase [Pseudovibrio exalbescens]|uniref:transposase n=1 Tax=Pseudovibrio exalbescens TaxID=197461 RepID=UPI002367112E|nr:transposase [Pseudovibrio exalbescens]MDD7911504.1 transposase [Pseudovibrio exalbescens]